MNGFLPMAYSCVAKCSKGYDVKRQLAICGDVVKKL
jgi:hypothetical protein